MSDEIERRRFGALVNQQAVRIKELEATIQSLQQENEALKAGIKEIEMPNTSPDLQALHVIAYGLDMLSSQPENARRAGWVWVQAVANEYLTERVTTPPQEPEDKV